VFDPNSAGDGSRRRRRSKQVGSVLLTVSFLGIALAFTTGAPYVIESPGPVFNALSTMDGKDIIQVKDLKTYETDGQLDVLTVSQRGTPESLPSWGEVAFAWLSSSRVLIPIDQVFGDNQNSQEQERITTQMMLDSQRDAIAVALKKEGFKFESWLAVDSIEKSSPAAKFFKPDDVLLEVNGEQPQSVEQITNELKRAAPNTVNFKVKRNGETVSFDVAPYYDESLKRWRVGLMLNYRYKFPADIKIDLGNVTGPSAGLIFTLALIDKLEPESLTGGNHIAGTGTIAPDGSVGPIGGIRLKMLGAVGSGATFFLAPRANCDEIVGNIPPGLQVVSVTNIDEALKALEELRAAKSAPSKTPLGCPTN
jgi:Lon-like protease